VCKLIGFSFKDASSLRAASAPSGRALANICASVCAAASDSMKAIDATIYTETISRSATNPYLRLVHNRIA
jgi:hypothetical protein